MTAFLLTWKESGWPHEHIVRLERALEVHGHVEEPWRIKAHNMAKPGDRVWLLRQGRGPKGIFGVGRIVALPKLSSTSSGKHQMMVMVRFEALVDPLRGLLISEPDVVSILQPNQIRAAASGYPIGDEQSAALETLFVAKGPVALEGKGDWTPAEVHAIVADYFKMLKDELGGRTYSKTEHRNALRQTVHRSPGSIERKHQNISAVLQELGFPWINGYKPLMNFQDALVDAIETQLAPETEWLDRVPLVSTVSLTEIDIRSVFVAPPPLSTPFSGRSISRVARKFDAAERDAVNRALGAAGESFVMEVERMRLTSAGRADLAARVVWVSRDLGDGLGYDIESFEENASPIVIEVKTTKGGIGTPFFVSENERRVAAERCSSFRIYRVFDQASNRKIYRIRGPLEDVLILQPVVYRARVIDGTK